MQLFVSLLLGLIIKYEKDLDQERELRNFVAEETMEDKALDAVLVFLNVICHYFMMCNFMIF